MFQINPLEYLLNEFWKLGHLVDQYLQDGFGGRKNDDHTVNKLMTDQRCMCFPWIKGPHEREKAPKWFQEKSERASWEM